LGFFSCAVAGNGMLITVDRSFARVSLIACGRAVLGCNIEFGVVFVEVAAHGIRDVEVFWWHCIIMRVLLRLCHKINVGDRGRSG
jgi:hypothetical protein